ncbi:MAG: malto-oligosyltrehalose trehalohydrolase [Acidimicrobiia bacterium]
MTTFSVWAPEAQTVQLMLGDERRPMVPGAGGWWVLSVPEAGPGTDYAFAIGGGPPLPDPRSPFQPDGPHGRSRVVDHSAFPWTDQAWTGPVPLSAGVIYELHVGTFTGAGTFEAAIERLDHLVDLGVTHIELMPVCEFPGTRGWGYDGVDLFAPHHAYGGPEGLKRLVDACHARRLGVLLDVVYNHLGPDGNYLAAYGPYFTDRYPTPWGQAVNFDGPGSDEVRRLVGDNACMWLEDYHIDGLRLDAVHAIYDTSALHILEELGTRVRALETRLGRRVVVIPESDLNDPRPVRPVAAGGYGLDASWSDDFHHALHAALTGEGSGYYGDFGSLADVADALEKVYVYDGRHSPYRGRRHGRPATGLTGHHFVGFFQNHDQVGNRAQGERSCHLVSLGKLKIGAALVAGAPFVPMLFAGEEWAASSPFCYFTDHQDPELGRAVSEGRRREFAAFGWEPSQVPDPQQPVTFERSKLDWAEVDKEPHAEMLAWHRQLLALRRRLPDLSDGNLARVRTIFDEEEGWLVMNRGAATVAANLSAERRFLPLPPEPGVVLLASAGYIRLSNDGRLDMPPETVAVLGPLE